jgi:hypothetical protein
MRAAESLQDGIATFRDWLSSRACFEMVQRNALRLLRLRSLPDCTTAKKYMEVAHSNGAHVVGGGMVGTR